jgi:hypothetical protein
VWRLNTKDGCYYGTTAAVNNLYAWYGYTEKKKAKIEWRYDMPVHELLPYLRGSRRAGDLVMRKVDRQWYPLSLDPVPALNPIQTQNKLAREEHDDDQIQFFYDSATASTTPPQFQRPLLASQSQRELQGRFRRRGPGIIGNTIIIPPYEESESYQVSQSGDEVANEKKRKKPKDTSARSLDEKHIAVVPVKSDVDAEFKKLDDKTRELFYRWHKH